MQTTVYCHTLIRYPPPIPGLSLCRPTAKPPADPVAAIAVDGSPMPASPARVGSAVRRRSKRAELDLQSLLEERVRSASVFPTHHGITRSNMTHNDLLRIQHVESPRATCDHSSPGAVDRAAPATPAISQPRCRWQSRW